MDFSHGSNQHSIRRIPHLWGIVCLLLLFLVSYAYTTAHSSIEYTERSAEHPVSSKGDIELIGQIGGWSVAVAVEGNYAYLGVGPRLVILNISNPASPVVVGQSAPLPAIVEDVTVVGSYAYIANDDSGLRIINVANPSAPFEVSFVDTPWNAYGVTVVGSYAYVANGTSGLHIINVGNQAEPFEVGSFKTPESANNVAVAGSYAYVTDSSGLHIIHVANPAAPFEVGSFETPGSAIAVAGSYAYVTDGNGLHIINVATPTNPFEVGFYDTPGLTNTDVTVVGSYAYVANGSSGLRLVDVSNPATPTEVGFVDTPGYAAGVAVTGNRAYVADRTDGLRLIEVSNPAAPSEIGSYIPAFAYDVKVVGNYAYAVGGGTGFNIINVETESNPTEVGSYRTPGFAQDVAVMGSYAYIADGETGLRIINVSNPAVPTEVGFYDTPGSAQGVAVVGSYVYIADKDKGLRIINVSDPTTPFEVGFYEPSEEAKSVDVTGNYAYVADSGGLRIINVANPSNPFEVGFYEMNSATDVTVVGSYAYITDYWDVSLVIINVSNPSTPIKVSSISTGGYPFDVTVVGDYAYVAASRYGGLRIIDVSTPANPTTIESYDTVGNAAGMAVAGDYVYVATVSGGLVILRFTEIIPTPTPTHTSTPTPLSTTTPTPTPSPSIQWEQLTLPAGISADEITNQLAVSPLDAETLFLPTSSGLYKSTNAGQSWTRLASSTLDYVFEVLIAPSNSQRLYLRSWDFYRSDDGGNSWTTVSEPSSMCSLSVAPSDANRLYARACGGSNGPGVFRSDDGGQTWTTPTTTFTEVLDTLVVAPHDSNLLIASNFEQLFHSLDGGQTWDVVPISTRYSGRPVFDPKPPYTLYLGHWTGLLRSLDGGETWQDSAVDREFKALIVSPADSNLVLGGNDETSVGISSSDTTWQATTWNAPTPLRWLARSLNDNSLIYAQTDSQLWRINPDTPDTNLANQIFLPLVQGGSSSVPSTAAEEALQRANLYRERLGVIPLQLHSSIVTAAQNHADYHMLNHDDPGAWANGPHGEVEGKRGYTGQWPSDRITAAGYPWFGGSEVMHFIGDPTASVDDWLATIYHRLIVLDPGAHYTGYGKGRNNETAVDVMDFGGGPTNTGIWSSAIPYPLAYPVDGQTEVPPLWGGGESPDPLPPGAERPVGYPFTLTGVHGALQVDFAEMRNSNGQLVAVHPNPPDCPTFDCYALIAVEPLQANTTYTVDARGTVGDVPFDERWTFTTGEAVGTTTRRQNKRLGPPWP